MAGNGIDTGTQEGASWPDGGGAPESFAFPDASALRARIQAQCEARRRALPSDGTEAYNARLRMLLCYEVLANDSLAFAFHRASWRRGRSWLSGSFFQRLIDGVISHLSLQAWLRIDCAHRTATLRIHEDMAAALDSAMRSEGIQLLDHYARMPTDLEQACHVLGEECDTLERAVAAARKQARALEDELTLVRQERQESACTHRAGLSPARDRD